MRAAPVESLRADVVPCHGLAAIIGAFFAGLTFSDFSPRWNLQPRVEAINEFLAPFFFFTMGARLNLNVLTPDLVVAAAVISVLAIVAKILGCGLPVYGRGREIDALSSPTV